MSVLSQSPSLEEATNATASEPPEVSVVVLVTGNPESLDRLHEELSTAVRPSQAAVEYIYVVEPKFAQLAEGLAGAAQRGDRLRVVRVGQPLGQTGLLRAGLPYCRGDILLTLPGRRRVESGVLSKLIAAVQNGADMAIASRAYRRDSWLSGTRSRLFHALVTRVAKTPSPIRDVTSGVRAFRLELLDSLPLYGDSATVLPLLALREGYSVVEVPATPHASDASGVRSPFVYLRSLLDLFGLFFLLRFTEKPLRFFGLVGSLALFPGIAILLTVAIQRFVGRPAADRPLMLLGVLFLVLGIQMIALGLVGEIIVHLSASKRASYRFRRDTDWQAK